VDIASRAESKATQHREVDATKERFQLYHQAEANPNATQQQLAQWFNDKFKKQINQSTVSRKIYPLLS